MLGGLPFGLPEGVFHHLLSGLPGWLQSEGGWEAAGRLREAGSFPFPFTARTEMQMS